MHFQFLVEDQSGAILIERLMEQIISAHPDVTYRCKPFRGIGGFTKKNTVKETRTGKLLDDLATYLRGFQRSLKGIQAAIIVVLDNDKNNPAEFLAGMQAVSAQNGITQDHVFCLAVEEMEAWLLGDRAAVLTAYPFAKSQVLNAYVQDSICGTWEVLADAVYPGGIAKFKKNHPTYVDIGGYKCEWARSIGEYMDLNGNQSPSFQQFMAEINRRIPAA